MNRWTRATYPRVYRLLEFLERHHRWLLAAEIALLVLALARAFSHLSELDWHDAADAALLILLVAFLGAHLAVSVRRGQRGYDFRRLMNRLIPGPTQRHTAAQLRSLIVTARAAGVAGAEIAAADRAAAAGAIARESASVFSERTFGSADPEWEATEGAILAEWFDRVGASAWRLQQNGLDCFSVIVPVCSESYGLIRRGYLPTYCAHLDRDVTARWATPAALRADAAAPPLRLLAYAQVAVPAAAPPADLSPLFHCSVEHLAHLLALHFGSAWGGPPDFHVICEASNAAQSNALQLLGFVPLQVERHGALEALLSPAGFQLCELIAGGGRSAPALRSFLEIFAKPIKPAE